MQSKDYVPGVSGWKYDKDGSFELNVSAVTDIKPSDLKLVTITAGQWPDCDLPANATERYAFIGTELAKIPVESRESAEFTTEDFSFDRDGSDYRTTLTYVRQETAEEAQARAEKAKSSGTRISMVNGVLTFTTDGEVRYRLGNLEKPEKPEPFVVVDGVVYVSEASIKDSTIKAELAPQWSLKMQVNEQGQYVAAGVGLGIGSQFLVSAERFSINCMCGGGPAGFGKK
ncbi:MAG: phage tail tip fiber protein [Pseudomonas fluorescens]